MSAHRLATLFAAALAAVLLAGCDAGQDPLARGAEAEGAGNLAEARARYQEVCAKGSKHCPLATRLLERLAVKEAWKAIGAGEYGKAKIALATGTASTDAAVKAAAEAASRDVAYVDGLAWEEAAALPDKEQALPRIEALVDLGVPASAQARAWLAKNRPGVLLARVKAACVAGARVSCAEAGRALASLHPESPENAEAQRLVEADYARVYPLLGQAERLIIQRVEVYDHEQLAAINAEKYPGGAEESAKLGGDRHLPTPAFLDGAWKKKLEEIGDPLFVKALEARYARAGSAGEQDPEPWPKPAGVR